MYSHAAATKYARFTDHLPDAGLSLLGGPLTPDKIFLFQYGETNRFVVKATVEGNKTSYSGYLWRPGEQRWKQLVTFRARTGGLPLRGLYSFVEDFRRDTQSVHELRRARFGNGWVKTTNGEWAPLARARFTASSAKWEAKENINAGGGGAWYFMATGGNIQMTTPLQSFITNAAAGGTPPELVLPDAK